VNYYLGLPLVAVYRVFYSR